MRHYQNDSSLTFKQTLNKTRDDLGEEVKKRLKFGRNIIQNFPIVYSEALENRANLKKFISELLSSNDAFFVPTIYKNSVSIEETTLEDTNMKLDMFSSWVNIVQGCAITIPKNNINVQFIGKQGDDFKILNLAKILSYNLNNE